MNRKKHFTLSKTLVVTLSLISTAGYANNFAVDGRGNAMGGVGVVSASYLTAPFYNPALGAVYRRNDNVGMILPGVGFGYINEGELIDDVDNINSVMNNSSLSPSDRNDQLTKLMGDIDGDFIRMELGAIAAFAIPNSYVSTNIFAKAYTDSYATPVISDSGYVVTQVDESVIQTTSVGVLELGVNLSKYYTLFGQHMTFGVAPKVQKVYTYVDSTSLEHFDFLENRDNTTSESTFNFDAGMLWFHGPLRVGLSGKNLLKRDIQTKHYTHTVAGKDIEVGYEYQLTPVYTLGLGYVDDYVSLSVDYDLNEDKRFNSFNDDEQMLRVGAEIDVMRQMQVRLGYKRNLSNESDAYTAGIGLSPLGLIHIDTAVSFSSMDNFGVYANFVTYY